MVLVFFALRVLAHLIVLRSLLSALYWVGGVTSGVLGELCSSRDRHDMVINMQGMFSRSLSSL